MNKPQAAPSGRSIIFLLAAIAALGSLATQLLVPALPQIAQELHANPAQAQLIIGIYLIGLGLGQLLAGPLADRIGRKPVLLAGLALYCLASIGAALAPSLPMLLIARAVQALGASAGVVTARVLVGDLFDDSEAAARQATLMAVVLISPALAPVIGGTLTQWIGWRAVFGVLAMAGIIGAGLTAWRLPARARPAPDHLHAAAHSHTRRGLLGDYRRLAQNRRFLCSAAAIAGGSSALYMYLGTAPFLLAHSHALTPQQVGICLLLVAVMSIGGTFLVAHIERRGNALIAGTAISAVGGLLLLLLAELGITGLVAFQAPMMLLGLGAGLTGPAGISRVIRSAPGLEGTAASLAGASQMLVSALAAYTLGHFTPVDTVRLGLGIALATGIAVLVATVGENRNTAAM